MTVRCFKNNLASRHRFFRLCNGRNFVLVLCRYSGSLTRLVIAERLRLAVTVVMLVIILVVILVVLPVVVGGLVVVVHVCFHVFVFLVKVGCSGSRIGCGGRVVYFGLVLRRIAES